MPAPLSWQWKPLDEKLIVDPKDIVRYLNYNLSKLSDRLALPDTQFRTVDAAGDADASNAIEDAAGSGYPFFPPGIYNVSRNQIVTKPWYGMRGYSTIMPFGAAVTKVLVLQNGGDLDGLIVDAANAPNVTGLDLASDGGLVNIVAARNMQIWRCNGAPAGAFAGGRGIMLGRLVSGTFENIYVCRKYINLHTNGGDTPTDTDFKHCQFREAVNWGIWFETGYGIRFWKPLLESNQKEAIMFKNVGGTAIDIDIDYPWYENNYASLALGAARHAKYSVVCDGATAGTIGFRHRAATINDAIGVSARAMHLTDCRGGFVDDNSRFPNEAGQVLLDGLTSAIFANWNMKNGDFRTTVTNLSGALPQIVGSRAANAALASLITQLAMRGVIEDLTTA